MKVENSSSVTVHPLPDGIGLYVNDRRRREVIHFLEQEIGFQNAKRVVAYDTTKASHYRLIGKGDSLKLYARRDDDADHVLLAEVSFLTDGSAEGNGYRPAVCQDKSGILHAVWHDDGNGVGQIHYANYSSGQWSEPELVLSSGFGIRNASIAADSLGRLFVAYESQRSSVSDIAFIYRQDKLWSEPELVAPSLGISQGPKLAADSQDNLHLVYADDKFGLSEVYYAIWNSKNLAWSKAEQVTTSDYGTFRPSVDTYGDRVFVSYTLAQPDLSKIAAVHKRATGDWSSEVSVSSPYKHADHSDLVIDAAGRPFVVWQDDKTTALEIYARTFNPSLLPLTGVVRLTDSANSSEQPVVARHRETGDIYVVWQDYREILPDTDPYLDPYRQVYGPGIYVAKHDAETGVWHSGFQNGFDIRLQPLDERLMSSPAIPKVFSGEMHVLHESLMARDVDEYLPTSETFSNIRDILYDLSVERVYYPLEETYYERDLVVSDRKLRAEIRFGDFSGSLGIKFKLKYLRYYLSDAVGPFSIKSLNGPAFGVDSLFASDAAVNNYGDVWIVSLCGSYFYFGRDNTLFQSDALASRAIAFDRNNTMFIARQSSVLYSLHHFGDLADAGISTTESISALATDRDNRLWVAILGEGVKAYAIAHGGETLTLTLDVALGSDELPSLDVTSVVADNNGAIWIGTRKGSCPILQGEHCNFWRRSGLVQQSSKRHCYSEYKH